MPPAESSPPSLPPVGHGGHAKAPVEQTRARPFMRLGALVYLYRRRLRVHGVQELLAGLGIASSVALVFATLVAGGSVAGSSAQLVHEVVGPATLQLRARGADGFDEHMLARVERLSGVKQAAPLLEQTATIEAADGRRLTVSLAGADTALTVLDGLAHTLPRETLSAGAVGLSQASAQALGIPTSASRQSGISLARDTPGVPAPTNAPVSAGELSTSSSSVTLLLRGQAQRLRISEVLGAATIGPLAGADVTVMPLESLQRLAGLPGRVTRVLVLAQPGREAQVRRELTTLAGGRIEVAAANQDVGLLRQALRPSDQASTLFATISVLLGVLFAFGALLLTVPERRRAIADLRLLGTRRSAIVQMLLFQALCLGVAASLVGLLGGYVLAKDVLHQSSGYLNEAFTLGSHTLISSGPALEAAFAGVLATCMASAVPLLDLLVPLGVRHSASLDAVYRAEGGSGATLSRSSRRWLATAGALPLAVATYLFASDPGNALLACELLALATVLAVPLTFAAVLRGGRMLAERRRRLTVLPVALASLQGTKLRSLALAGTGALALFGAVALGGARADLLRGVQHFAHSYAAEADIWVGAPGDNQATVDFRASGLATRIERIHGVASVQAFRGGFVQLDTEKSTPSGAQTPHGAGRRQTGGRPSRVAACAARRRRARTARRPDRGRQPRKRGAAAWRRRLDRRFRTDRRSGTRRCRRHAAAADAKWQRVDARRGHDDQPRLEPWRDPHERGRLQPSVGEQRTNRARRAAHARGQPGPRARASARGARAGKWPAGDQFAGARSEHRRADRRRAQPPAGDIDVAADRSHDRDGSRAELGDLAATRVAGDAAPLGRQARTDTHDPHSRVGADARRRLHHRRAGGYIRPTRDRRLPAPRDRLSGGKPGREPASDRDPGACDRGRIDNRCFARVARIACFPDPCAQ